ncbi:hypothetical protein NQ317_005772, partial [Molorchus minor]
FKNIFSYFPQVELVKQTEEGDVSNYQANGEFDLISFSSVKHVEFYSCCPEPYPDITYTIKLRRRPLFYVFNLILPCILINGIGKGFRWVEVENASEHTNTLPFFPSDKEVLVERGILKLSKKNSLANLAVSFLRSFQNQAKEVTLGISALLSMTVFLMTIRETLPPTEKTPLINGYRLQVNPATPRERRVQAHLELAELVEILARLLVMRKLDTQLAFCCLGIGIERSSDRIFIFDDLFCQLHSPYRCRAEVNPQTGTRLDCPWPWLDKQPQEDGYCLQQRQQRSPRFVPKGRETDFDVFENQIIRILNKVHASVDRNEQRLTEQDRKELTELEWKQTSIVLDRVLLGIFFLITIISTTTILCRSPQDQTP